MALGKKKNKPAEVVTPEEVASLGHKHEVEAAKDKKSSVYEHFHAQDNAKAVADAKKRKKRYAVILGALIAVLLIIYIISMLTTQWGDLVISIGDVSGGKTIMLSEHEDFSDATVKLNGGSVREVTNITKSWLPKNIDDSKGGDHGDKNYIAYTFFLKNTGDEKLDYNVDMTVTGASKSVDEAVRVTVFKNGEESTYAKGSYKDRATAETDATKWVDTTKIMEMKKISLDAKAQDKYTVVIWIEGNDPECVDAIRGGHVRMQMVFNVVNEEDKSK